MKTKQIRELGATEIAAKLKETREELANLKFQHSLHQLDNAVKVRLVRRRLARMVTILQEIESGIADQRAARAGRRE
jgi:large subunit ribosomal protein L29